MSQTRIRVEKTPTLRNTLAAAAGVAAIGLIVVFFTFESYWVGCSRAARETAEGRILDTRIVVVNVRESQFGTRAKYRIEARVTYDLHGQVQDRWVPVPEIVTDKRLLEARLATHPKSCEVSWPTANPENASCRLR
jgi:hypothetical protein